MNILAGMGGLTDSQSLDQEEGSSKHAFLLVNWCSSTAGLVKKEILPSFFPRTDLSAFLDDILNSFSLQDYAGDRLSGMTQEWQKRGGWDPSAEDEESEVNIPKSLVGCERTFGARDEKAFVLTLRLEV